MGKSSYRMTSVSQVSVFQKVLGSPMCSGSQQESSGIIKLGHCQNLLMRLFTKGEQDLGNNKGWYSWEQLLPALI